MVTIAEVFHALFTVGVVCEFGEQGCEMFSAVEYTFDEIDWYLYPIEMQRMLPKILIVVQKPIYVDLFGSVTASRETFLGVSMAECVR